MQFNRPKIKSLAKVQLQGNFFNLLIITLILGLVTLIPIAGQILAPGLTLSLCMVYLGQSYGNNAQISNSFGGVRHLGKAWWLTILMGFFTALWSILFVIPGIVKAISYSMAPFVLADDPTLTARQALDISKQITDGHKLDLFLVGLSFIGWSLLVSFTFGIAAIWVVPYMCATYANCYQTLKNAH